MKNEIPSLQFLRGFFTILVLLAHVNLLVDETWMRGFFIPGWCGVDMFFILSGFLVIYTYRPGRTVRQHVLKKFIRIYPVSFILTFFFLLLSVLTLQFTGKNMVTGWTDVGQGWHSIICSFLLLPTDVAINDMPIVPPAWTLPYEVLFYIVEIVMLVWGLRCFCYVCVVWLLLIIGNIFVPSLTGYPWQFPMDLLFIEFFLGMFIAGVLRLSARHILRRILHRYAMECVSIGAGLVCLSWIGILVNSDIIVGLHRVVKFGIPFGMVLIGLAQESGSVLGNWLSRTWFYHFMLQCAKQSYSLYLTHFVTASLLSRVLSRVSGLGSGGRFVLVTLICYGAGVLVWRLLEEPATRHLKEILKV